MAKADFSFRALRPADAQDLAAKMRAEDAAEVLASAGMTPLQAVRASVDSSDLVAALELGGELAALFGVSRGPMPALLGPSAFDVVWALTGAPVSKHPRAFWRASQVALAALLADYPVLLNSIDARYSAALRWAKRLGAEVHAAAPYGTSGLPFHNVIWRRPAHV